MFAGCSQKFIILNYNVFDDKQGVGKLEGLLGQVTCFLSHKNGVTIKFLSAKRAGIGSKMYYHSENRDKLLQCLDEFCLKNSMEKH